MNLSFYTATHRHLEIFGTNAFLIFAGTAELGGGNVFRLCGFFLSVAFLFSPLDITELIFSCKTEFKWCRFWSKVVTSEVQQRPTLLTAGTGINLIFNVRWKNYLNFDYTVTLLSYYLPCRWTTDKVMLKSRFYIISKLDFYWLFSVAAPVSWNNFQFIIILVYLL